MQFLKKLIDALNKNSGCKKEQYIPARWNYFGYPCKKSSRRSGECIVNAVEFSKSTLENIAAKAPQPCVSEQSEMVIYSMLPRCFSAWDCTEEGKVENGTLLRCICLLPLLRKMGINVIYLLPVFVCSQEAKKGEFPSPYAIKDIKKIDPALHDALTDLSPEEEFGAFVEAAHHLGIRVMLDFVFRTCGRDNVLIKEHPDWFYWIDERNAEELRSPEIAGMEQSVVSRENIGKLYASQDMERFLSCFREPPAIDQWQAIVSESEKSGESLNSISARELGIVTLTGFADTINDPQPPWTDITYYKYYFDVNDSAKAFLQRDYPPFIAQDGVKCSVFPAGRPNLELWDYIAGIIPYYIKKYGIDGARIDMAHALPDELNSRIIQGIFAANPSFILWSEEFFPKNADKAKKQGYHFILGDVFFAWKDYGRSAFTEKLFAASNASLRVTAALETPDTPRAFEMLRKKEKVKAAIALCFFMPNSIPMINSGLELCERQPMNLGLMNDENGRFVLEKDHPMYGRLAFFDSFMMDWRNPFAEEMTEFIAKLAEIRCKYSAFMDRNDFKLAVYKGKSAIIDYCNVKDDLVIIVNCSDMKAAAWNSAADKKEKILFAENADKRSIRPNGILILHCKGE